ncbi:LysR family transcriptional regulator [Paraburkholderia sp.]|uniref:LysR family transcriptional regulator n=1 Tax=Paraburkholderia sp. TaxID=1926495 RepID=UPI002394F991|nr:LysR family transcriptional regulator [Paraburkholderia sp.]MDE1180573.1 LysR family transcriptional regulator [Paraburkholderia sp.]
MDTFHNMRVFLRVVDAGSFTGAAQRLHSTTAQVSRSVSDLESHLRTRLLNRTTRRLALTEAGERYLHRCEQILACVDQAEGEAADSHARPSGKLKVHAMTSFGQHYLIPAINAYQQRYPDVRVELTLSHHLPDLIEEGFDISLTVAAGLPDSSLVSQQLGSGFSIACASPDYLRARGVPLTPAELREHTCLQMVTTVFAADTWRFDGPNGEETFSPSNTAFRINNAEALAVAVSKGMGVGVVPIYSAIAGLRSGELVRILPDYVSQRMTIHALYPSRQYVDSKVRTWVEFLREYLPVVLDNDKAELCNFACAQPLDIPAVSDVEQTTDALGV